MNIKELYIDDLSEIAYLMYQDAVKLDDIGSITAFGYYEDIAVLIKELLQYEDTYVCNIELHEETLQGYSDIFALAVSEDLGIWIEPMLVNGEYLGYEADKVYIADDCTTAILKKNENLDAPIFSFGYDLDECDCCHECDCDLHKCDTDKSAVSSASTTPTVSYKVNGKECSKEEYEKKRNEIIKDIDKFEDEFLDMFENAIRTKARIMDDFDRLLRLW